MAESRGAFRRRLGRLLNVMTAATTNGAGSTTSFTATPLSDVYTADDTMNGAALYDVTGAEWRVVNSWNSTSGVGTVSRAFTSSIATDRAVEVYEQFTPRQLDDALRMALDEAYAYISIEIIDESNVVLADTYEYTIPDSIRDFSRMAGGKVTVSLNETINTWPRIELEDWETRTDGETVTLVLPSISGIIGKTLRLHAKGAPSFPASDASLIPLRSDTLQLLAFKAAEAAWRTGPGLSGRDAEFAANQEAKWAAKFDEKRDEWGIQLNPTQWKWNTDTPLREYPLAYFHKDPS